MNIQPTTIPDLYLIEPERLIDERGFFARVSCSQAFAEAGIDVSFSQSSVSWNHHQGTLRGMHLQREPHAETKLVRCTQGGIFDVIVDVRPDSPTFCCWQGFELSAENRRELLIGPGLAHGFQTLVDGCEVFYQISQEYHAKSAFGYRFDDPAFAINWPLPVSMISTKDRTWPFVGRQQVAA